MNSDQLQELKEALIKTVTLTVNGKIDKLTLKMDTHNNKHEADMQRILPIIEAFEISEKIVQGAKSTGKIVIVLAGFIMTLGGAFLIIKQIFRQ